MNNESFLQHRITYEVANELSELQQSISPGTQTYCQGGHQGCKKYQICGLE